ncbi:MAG: M23 family metallopeptidase [Bacteroidetes bacterium]|nr:MAG: M23 family metallopeptidase [Bacteroidota bacterium]
MFRLYLRTVGVLIAILPAFSFGHPGRASVVPTEAPFPKDYFRMPVELADVRLSGTFGELRANHFHTGIDISSKTGTVGLPVYAPADGFVDRIKVQETGYGNALYIRHPNGYTTVYGHLDRFAPEVEKYVREVQYKRERFSVDLYPKDGLFPVKKGAQIANMGNSGSSGGPHLHFEIRRSSDQKALNPLLFGLPVPDDVPPHLRDMKVYYLNPDREVLESQSLAIEPRPDGTYGVQGDTVRLPAWRVGFGLRAYDQATGNPHNKNGLYSLVLKANDHTEYKWQADEIDFGESRYLNAHTDYAVHARNGAMYHRCFVLPGDRLSNYTRTESLGAVPLYKDIPAEIVLEAVDASGNESTVRFWAFRGDPQPQDPPPHQFKLPYDVSNQVDLKDFSMSIPKGALYETLYFRHELLPAEPDMYSEIHQVHERTVPLHRYCTMRIRPDNLPEHLRSKAVVARTRNSRPVNCGGEWEDGFVVTRVRDFGDYCVMVDTTPPSIKPVVFSVDMRRKKTMSFRISDDFRTDARAKGLRFRGTVDGKWILFEYDKKRARLTYYFDGHIDKGEHTLRLVVTDDRGNDAVFERNFVR